MHMNIRTLAAASAALGLLATASVANAAITVNTSAGYPVADDLFGATLGLNDQTMLWDFDAIAYSNATYTGNVLQGPQSTGTSASPPTAAASWATPRSTLRLSPSAPRPAPLL